MQREAGVETNAAYRPAARNLQGTASDWRDVDCALRTIAQRRAGLDAEEAHWVRQAEALQIWRPLGMVSMLDYLERAMGYAPRTGQDRLRVARSLGALPGLTAALTAGALGFSAVRELTRVATPATETAWIAAATGKNLRQIEELVAGHREGDLPGDPPDPEARKHVVRYELSAETFALMRQARTLIDDDRGTNSSDDAFIVALCSAVIGGAPAAEPTGRAKFQIAVTVCVRCRQGWQEGGGAQIPIGAAAVERALCDAQHIGSIDDDAPARAYQDIPPSVARFVWRRDGGRCRVPGCRSARGLELHHLVHRADGGSHDALNVSLICSSCHQAHHDGTLTISGTPERLEVRRSGTASLGGDVRAHVGAAAAPDTAQPCGSDVRAAVEPSAETQPRAHVGAAAAVDTAQLSRSDVRASVGPSAQAQRRAHVGAAAAPDGETQPRAHEGAAAAPGGETQPRAHVGVAAAADTAQLSRSDVRASVGPSADAQPRARVGAAAPDAARLFRSEARASVEPSTEAQPRAHVGAAAAPDGEPQAGAHVSAAVEASTSPDRSAEAPLHRAAVATTFLDNTCIREQPATRLDAAILRAQSKEALVGLGWKPAIATAAVASAWATVGPQASLEQLIFEALRSCPRSSATAEHAPRAR